MRTESSANAQVLKYIKYTIGTRETHVPNQPLTTNEGRAIHVLCVSVSQAYHLVDHHCRASGSQLVSGALGHQTQTHGAPGIRAI